MGTPGSFWGWALQGVSGFGQGVSGVGHSRVSRLGTPGSLCWALRETLALGTPGRLWGWAFQGDSGAGWALWGWALQRVWGWAFPGVFDVGHSRESLGVDRARRRVPGEEKS